ncbi:unnamed protein product, partial [Adineta steineri]
AHHHHHLQHGSTISEGYIINKEAPSPPSSSSTHQPCKGPSGSSTYLQGSNRVKTMTIMGSTTSSGSSWDNNAPSSVTRAQIIIL